MSYPSADDVGARVTVRRRGPDGALRDIVGELEAADADVLAIRDRTGDLVLVNAADIVAARVVGPSPREAIELEAVSGRGWPASDEEWLGRWWLRAADGFTRRANSLRPLGSPGIDLDAALARVIEWYGARGLPPRARVVVGTSYDRELAGRGWAPHAQTIVMAATCARVSGRLRARGRGVGEVEIARDPSSPWLRLFREGPLPLVARRALGGERVAFAQILDAAGAVAIGRASVENPWVGLTAIEVRPDARRRGHARAIVDALLAWAAGAGAGRTYLEVLASNTPAITLYESLGFAEHHRYVYREHV